MAETSSADAAAPAAIAVEDLPRLSLEILETIKVSQNQNGLRHNDFARYRQYCARRLRRLRTSAAVKFTHGKGKKYVPRELTPEVVRDPGHLMVALYNAERAWAYFKELESEESAGFRIGIRHEHLRHRLQKAAEWATLLQSLCTARADARTCIEAEAYAACMSGTLSTLEREWEAALKHFTLARSIYGELAKVAARRQKELYMSRVEELAPNERLCRYNLTRSQKQQQSTNAANGKSQQTVDAVAAAATGDLKSKIDAAVAEQRSGGAAEGSGGSSNGASSSSNGSSSGVGASSVMWRSTLVPVRSDKLRAAFAAAADKAMQFAEMSRTTATSSTTEEAAGSSSSTTNTNNNSTTEGLYVEVLSRYDDASRIAMIEATRASKDGKDALAADYYAADEYARYLRARLTLERGLVAAASIEADFWAIDQGKQAGNNSNSSKTSADGSTIATSSSAFSSPASKKKKSKEVVVPAATPATKKGAASSSALLLSPAPPVPPSAWSDSPLHVALAKVNGTAGTGSSSSSSSNATGAAASDSASNALAATAAANQVTSWYARLIRMVDDMIVLASNTSTTASSSSSSSSSTTTTTASSSSTTTTAVTRGSGLPADRDLVSALQARRTFLLAWRAWYVSLSYLHAKRFADAAALLGRARTRALTALDTYKALPSAGGGAGLPKEASPVGTDDASLPLHITLSGVCSGHITSLTRLVDSIDTRSISITASGLLEHLAPSVRSDKEVTSLYSHGILPLSPPDSKATLDAGLDPLPAKLIRSMRKQWITERTTSYATLEASGDGDAAALYPALTSVSSIPLLVMPAKPVLFDLAFNGVAYPDAVTSAPTPNHHHGGGGGGGGSSSGSSSSTSGSSSGGGLLSWITGK